MANGKIDNIDDSEVRHPKYDELKSFEDAFRIGIERKSVEIRNPELVDFDHAFPVLDKELEQHDANYIENSTLNQYDDYVNDDRDALENVLKARYNLTDEVAKAFSAKLDTAARIQKLRDELEWPPAKIEFYKDREPLPETGRKETAIEFYNRVWKPSADAWLISQEILKNKFGEDKLVPAIRSQCQREKIEFSHHAPPSQSKLNDLLASIDLSNNSKAAIDHKRSRDLERIKSKLQKEI